MLSRFIRRVLTPPMVVVAALLAFGEEWLWVRMTAAMAWVGRIPVLRWLEGRLARLPAWAALVGFFVPGLLLLPVKIGAVFLMGRGQVGAGLAVIVGAKVLGTAVVARFFTVCKPVLLGVGWFRAGHDWLGWAKDSLYARLRAMALWQAVQEWRGRLRRWLRGLRPGVVGRRWRAIGARLRRLRRRGG